MISLFCEVDSGKIKFVEKSAIERAENIRLHLPWVMGHARLSLKKNHILRVEIFSPVYETICLRNDRICYETERKEGSRARSWIFDSNCCQRVSLSLLLTLPCFFNVLPRRAEIWGCLHNFASDHPCQKHRYPMICVKHHI